MDKKSKQKFSFKDAGKLYRFIWSHSARDQVIVCLVALLTLPFTLAPLELQRRIIDDAVADKSVELLLTLAAIYAGVVIAQQVVKFTYNLLRGRLTEKMNQAMRNRIIQEPELDTEEDGDVVSMLTGEVEPIGGFSGDAYAQVVTEGGVLLTIFGYMLYTEFWLAVVAIAAFIPQALATPLVQDRINAQSAERIAQIRGVGSDAIAARQGDNGKRAQALERVGRIFDIRLLIYKLKFALKAALNLMDHLADLIVLAVGGYMAVQGQTEIGVVVAFLSGLGQLRSPWRTLISYFRVSPDAQMRFSILTEKVDLSVEAKG